MIQALPYLAFTMGLMSSFHCIGMCGPIALALPVHRGSLWTKLTGLALYNGGRILIYAILGVLIGVIGTGIEWMGYLRYISILAGLLMLIFVLWPYRLNPFLRMPVFWQRIVNELKKSMSAKLKSNNWQSWFILGSLNGLLPCGLVYMALVTSVSTGTVSGSSLFMLSFGLGTLPTMTAVGFFKNLFTPALRTRLRKLTPVMIAIAGIWLVARGILVQYPANSSSSKSITICHGK